MTQDKTIEKNGFTYLEALDYNEDEDKLQVAAGFAKLDLAKPPVNVFNAEGFPAKNLDDFLFIPLYLNPAKKAMYIGPYTGEARPPACWSENGVTPVKPLDYNGQVITQCAGCPLYGYGSKFPCNDRPTMIGLAYFPAYGDLLVPIRKDIPSKSIKAFNGLCKELNSPVNLNGQFKNLPVFARIVKVGSKPESSNFGPISAFTFELHGPMSKLGPADPMFVPEHLIQEIQKMYGLAKSYVTQQSAPALTGGSAVAALPGGAVEQPAQNDATVLQAEDEAEY